MEDHRTRRSSRNTLILIFVLLLVWLAMFVGAAFAQTSESVSESGANAEVDVSTGAVAGAQIINQGQRPGADNRVYAEVASAPSLGGLALGGGHPCAYAPATLQISIIGSGAGAGGMKIDSACMLVIMGAAGDERAYKAAQLMLAARDPAACQAMESAGLVNCMTAAEARAMRAGAPSRPASSASASSVCQLEGNRLRFRPSTAAARDAELAACKRQWGVR